MLAEQIGTVFALIPSVNALFNSIHPFGEDLIDAQYIIGFAAVGLLFFVELSDQSYGKTPKIVSMLRKCLLPICIVMLILLFTIGAMKIYGLLIAPVA